MVQPDDPAAAEPAPPPELADWWVWGVRRVAAIVADLLLAARAIAVIVILLKAGLWVFSRETRELVELGLAAGALALLWAIGLLLGRFSVERELPDAESWLHRRRRRN
jgi:hypothetical protein